MRQTKIVCTIGPASESPEQLENLIKAGMNVARLNFSHSTHQKHREIYYRIREISKKLQVPIAILADLQGPKIRVGKIKNNSTLTLCKNEQFTITVRDILGENNIISTTYKNLHNDIQTGDTILIDDGILQLKVELIKDEDIICKVINGGMLKANKGINLPNVKIGLPALTIKDKKDLELILELDFDYIALSFVRTKEDILVLKDILKKHKVNIPVIAKIEKPEALENLIDILEVSEGVMVARGDLGVELSVEKVPAIQKKIIRLANSLDKIVITATQMLESMTQNPIPTRAEASDVANAIFDGTDAIMLSAETAAGKYPIESVETMNRISLEAESEINKDLKITPQSNDASTFGEAICDAAFRAAEDMNAKFLIIETLSGRTARLMSKFRPKMPIIAITSNPIGFNRMAMYHNVKPLLIPAFIDNMEENITYTEKELKKRNLIQTDDILVFIFGLPLSGEGHTNAIRLHKVR